MRFFDIDMYLLSIQSFSTDCGLSAFVRFCFNYNTFDFVGGLDCIGSFLLNRKILNLNKYGL